METAKKTDDVNKGKRDRRLRFISLYLVLVSSSFCNSFGSAGRFSIGEKKHSIRSSATSAISVLTSS
jgi:hypothetical protein